MEGPWGSVDHQPGFGSWYEARETQTANPPLSTVKLANEISSSYIHAVHRNPG